MSLNGFFYIATSYSSIHSKKEICVHTPNIMANAAYTKE